MNAAKEESWDFLTEDEADFVDAVMGELRELPSIQPLLKGIAEGGGLTGANKARFFELRFAHALHGAGIIPRYEVAGEGESTLDFGFAAGGHDWLVELMRLEETQAVKAATSATVDSDGIPWRSMVLSTAAEDRRQSLEGETLKAVQRICQKCERDGRPHKFPAPAGALHVLLVDFRTFMNGGDRDDRLHVGLGGDFVGNEFNRLHWEGKLITGAYHPRTTMKGAEYFRERVHFLGFVDEKKYEPGAFAAGTQFIANPHMFKSGAEAKAALASWPLQPAVLLNGRD
jgi:hypothetical protein